MVTTGPALPPLQAMCYDAALNTCVVFQPLLLRPETKGLVGSTNTLTARVVFPRRQGTVMTVPATPAFFDALVRFVGRPAFGRLVVGVEMVTVANTTLQTVGFEGVVIGLGEYSPSGIVVPSWDGGLFGGVGGHFKSFSAIFGKRKGLFLNLGLFKLFINL